MECGHIAWTPSHCGRASLCYYEDLSYGYLIFALLITQPFKQNELFPSLRPPEQTNPTKGHKGKLQRCQGPCHGEQTPSHPDPGIPGRVLWTLPPHPLRQAPAQDTDQSPLSTQPVCTCSPPYVSQRGPRTAGLSRGPGSSRPAVEPWADSGSEPSQGDLEWAGPAHPLPAASLGSYMVFGASAQSCIPAASPSE